MLPVIALVGRPNVGKSTLFNRLTQTRDALVADTPGLTRDRQYGIGRLGPQPYVVVDTGGLGGEASELATLMEGQVQRAIDEADHVLFLVDGQDGCVPGDQEIALRLRRAGKPLTLVVNKTDQRDPDLAAADFHVLGLGDPVPIAAAHGRGVAALMTRTLDAMPVSPTPSAGNAPDDADRIRVAIVGRPNAGKSTLINRLLGEERVVTYDSPGTTRDTLFIPFDRLDQRYTLIDTAGVRRRARVRDVVEKFSVIKTLQAIAACHVVVLVVDAQAGIGEHDATLAGHILESGRALVVAVNKWDGLDPDRRDGIRRDLQRKLAFLDFAAYHYISALHGSGVGLLLDEVDRIYANAVRDLSTPELTRLLEAAVQEHQPPLVHGRRVKLRYAHQGGRNPPLIIIHGTQTEAVPASYKRYLINRFRRALDLQGTPLRIELRSGANPFAGRRNSLTPRQSKKRRRLREHTSRR
jgi:GTP-binding protein